MVLPKDAKVCFYGSLHPVPFDRSKFNKRIPGEFAVAFASVYTHHQAKDVCKDHLNSMLDYADDNPQFEPNRIEWLV